MFTPLDSQNLLSSQKVKLKNPYKLVFILFKVSLICPITFKQSKGCRAKIFSLFSIIILVMFTVPNVMTLWTLGVSSISIGNVTVNIVSICHRYLLGNKLETMKSIAWFIQRHRPNNSRIPKWIYLWVFASTALHAALVVLSIATMNMEGSEKSFGMQNASGLTRVLLSSFAAATVFLFVLPINTFSIFYVLVCLQTRDFPRRFARSLRRHSKREGGTSTDFGSLLTSYRSIKNAVGILDDQLSFLMLLSVAFSSLLMFMAVSLILHPSREYERTMQVAIFIYFAISQASFLAMTAAASAVSEASGEVADAAEGLPSGDGGRCLGEARQRFLAATRSEIAFTVWKIVPIKRNFIVGTLGAIFTYVILIDGLAKY